MYIHQHIVIARHVSHTMAEAIMAARRERGKAYATVWAASGVTGFVDNVLHGQYVIHVPTGNLSNVNGAVMQRVLPGQVSIPCYTLLLGSPNPLAVYNPDGGIRASKTWTAYTIDHASTDGRMTKCMDLKSRAPLKIMVSDLSVCNHTMFCVSSESMHLSPQTHVVGCSCPDWFHRHKELAGTYNAHGQTGDNYRGCKHMWALRILLEPLTSTSTPE